MRTATEPDTGPVPAGTDAPEPPPRRWPRLLALPLGIYLLSRIATVGAALIATWLAPALTVPQVLGGWDGGWYLRIAEFGYPDSVVSEGGGNRWAFFPGLPGLVKIGTSITPFDYRTVGLVVALILGALMTIAVWIAVDDFFGRTTATVTVAFLCFFPAAYTFSMVYTEGLFLACSAGTLALLKRDRWALAGLVAGAGCLSRRPGLVLVLVCLVAAGAAIRRDRRLMPLIAPAIATVPAIFWCVYQWVEVGTPLAFVKAEEAWGPGFVWFRTPFESALHVFTRRSAWSNAQEVMATFGVVFVLVGFGLLIALHRRGERLPLYWWVYTVGIALAAFSPFWPSSILRYTMAVFPLLIGYARFIPAKHHSAVTATLGTLMGALAVVAFASQITWQTAPFAP